MYEKFYKKLKELKKMPNEEIAKLPFIDDKFIFYSEIFEYRKYKFELQLLIDKLDNEFYKIINANDLEEFHDQMSCIFDCHAFFSSWIELDYFNDLVISIYEDIDIILDETLNSINEQILSLEESKKFFEIKINEINGR